MAAQPPDNSNSERTNDTRTISGSGESTQTKPEYLVGVGASAGGLEALRALFSGLADIERLAFIFRTF